VSDNRHKRIADWIAAPLCIFFILFPKGGIKIGPVPITWGYLLLGVSALLAFPWGLATGFRVPRLAWLALLCASVFPGVLVFSILSNGVEDWGFAISEISSFIILPFVMLVAYGYWWPRIDRAFFFRILRFCVFAAAFYGIVLFVWHIVTGSYIEIPYLTVNAEDAGTLEQTKHIDRGGIFKLISTYNNGNLYGVATLLLLPLFDALEGARRWRKVLVRVALVLTLSRAVWLGIVLEQLLGVFQVAVRDLIRLRLSARTVKAFALLAPMVALVFAGLLFLSRGIGFLLDPTFGGRAEQFAAFSNFTILPAAPVNGIGEVVYASTLNGFGMLGLVGMSLLLSSPAVLSLLAPDILTNPIRRAALKGLILYLFLAWLDGGISYIPVMAFWWFSMMLLVYPAGARSNLTNGKVGVAVSC
jgi:hypothetical protein